MSLADEQEAQVRAYVQQHCITEEYHGTCRTLHPNDHLFLIFFDFAQAGLVIDPKSGVPVLVIERECDELSTNEMVSTSARTMYLMDLPDTQRTALGKYFLVRADVVAEIGSLGLA